MDTKSTTTSSSTKPVVPTNSTLCEAPRRRVSWGAIIAGAFVAVATMIVLGFLGAAIGLWSVEPGGETDTFTGMATGTAIYLVVTQLAALFVGGYVASRMSAAWGRQNAVLHGVVVWALATIAAIWLTVSTVGSIFNTTVAAVRDAASAVSTATTAVIPDQLPNFDMPQVSMDMLPARVQNALRQQGVTAENLKSEAHEAFRNVISRQEQAEAREIATDAAVDIIRTPSDAMSDVEAAIDDLVGKGGVLSRAEREELLSVLERRFDISESEAEAMLNRWQEEAQSVYKDAKEALATAQQEAIDAGDAATDALGTASFWTFVGLLLGLAAAGGGAAAGRRSDTDDEWMERRAEMAST